MTAFPPIPPGATLGIVGGGQLGRMTALAAGALGYHCHIFTPEHDSPAAEVAHDVTVASYNDTQALARFADAVSVVTFEFENIPAASVKLLSEHVFVRPNWECLATAQDRIREKTFAANLGIETAPWAKVTDAQSLADAMEDIGPNAILKTTRLGYDGKGQVRMNASTDVNAAWQSLNTDEGILEGFVDFVREISVIVARTPDGRTRTFEPVENHHKDGILDITIAPAPIDSTLADAACDIATRMANKLDLAGLLAVEMFQTRDGHLLVNEMAPRPHNSGHWTMDACVTSQFEQFVRAICALPLGDASRHSDAVMKNLIGADANDWAHILNDPDNKLHLYGKKEARAGRKMGHVNRIYAKGTNPRPA